MSTDFQDLFAGVKDALGDVLGGARPRRQTPDQPSYYEQYFAQVAGGPFGAGAPDLGYSAGAGRAAPNFGVTLAAGPFGAGGAADPYGARFGVALGGDPFGGDYAARQLAAYDAANAAKKARDASRAASVSGTAVEAGDWSGPATADDNASLTPEAIDNYIRSKNPNSPLIGKGRAILGAANRYGISAPLMVGIFGKESSWGSTAGPGFNLSGITDPGRDQGLGGQRAFQGFGSWEAAIDATARNLAGPNYKGKSAADQIGTWYVGKAGDLEATDLAGNGTVRQYLDNFVGPAYAGLGVPYNPSGAGSRRAGGGATGGLMGVTGGRGSITQEFGTTDYSEANPDVYSFAVSMGLRAGQHSGIDLGVPRGSQLFVPVSGVVTIAGGSGFYTDESGDGPGRGELRIRLDDGSELILGHMSSISLRPGQRVTAGTLAGLSGGSDGAHVHVEMRIRDRSTPSGWRIIDPRTRLGAGTAYTAPIQRGRPS
jgi:murein DD-endopeptidase MepM/ murein hydrolase activator NlpD